MKNFLYSIAALICAASMSPLFAVEGNGLLVNVFKRTVGKTDIKTEYISGKEMSINLVVSVKNTSLHNMPESQLRWTFLVKKGYTYLTEKESGVETIKALRVSETVEIPVGPVKVGEYHSGSASTYNHKEYKDKMDYEIIITQDAQELIRVGSDASFAKSTKPITPVAGEVPIRALPKTPGEDFGAGDGEKPKPIIAEVKPAEFKPLVGKEDMPPVSITPTPSIVNTTPPPQKEYSVAKPFDFFNLGGNRK